MKKKIHLNCLKSYIFQNIVSFVITHQPFPLNFTFHFLFFFVIIIIIIIIIIFTFFLILRHCVVIDLYVYCQLKQMVIEPPWAQYSYQCGETISQILTRREKK